MTPATSCATAENSSPALAPSATSVATRLSADCSSRSRLTWSRASLFAIAVETSSVNAVRCGSTSPGRVSPCLVPMPRTPQTFPSTTIGKPTADWMPLARAAAGAVPATSENRRLALGVRSRRPRRAPRSVERPPAAHRELGNAQRGEDDRLPVLVAIDADHRYAEEAGDLSRNGFEQNVAGRTLGDERCDPAQGRPARPASRRRLVARLAVGDRSGDEFGEVQEPHLGVLGKRLRGGDTDHTPEPPLDENRARDAGVQSRLPPRGSDLSGQVRGVAVRAGFLVCHTDANELGPSSR